MADGRHIENCFFGNISVPYWPIYANFGLEMKNHRQISVTWPKWQFSQIQDGGGPPFWNSFISISQSELSDFEQIWYGDANFHSENGYLTKKSKFFKFKMADGRHIENRFFGYISAPYWPIDGKFGKEMKNHMPIQVTWTKLQFSQIQDGGRPPFWKQFSVFTSFL